MDIGLLPTLPKFPKVQRAKTSKVTKGRPVTTEEFERMLTATPEVVGERSADSWRFYLDGLWTSGLRLYESLNLWWSGHQGIVVDLSRRHAMLRIPADAEKGNRDRLLPVAPEFEELLLTVPEEERRGRVFKLRGIDKQRVQGGGRKPVDAVTDAECVSRVVCLIGKRAKVVVDRREKRDRNPKRKGLGPKRPAFLTSTERTEHE